MYQMLDDQTANVSIPPEEGDAIAKDRAIIFDGDDTLWEIQPLYDEAKELFAGMVSSKLKMERAQVIAALDEIDMRNISKMGFSPTRFPHSMVETLKMFYSAKGIAPTEEDLEQAYLFGSSVFSKTPKLLDGVEDVLMSLSHSFRLILYTMGDIEIQKRFITMLHLNKYFKKSIYIVSKKSSYELQTLLTFNNLNPKDVWIVGNSLRSDINPALQLNIKCIWIRLHSWVYDTSQKLSGEVFEISSLRELFDIIT